MKSVDIHSELDQSSSGEIHGRLPEELGFELPPPQRLNRARLIVLGLIACAAALALTIFGFLPKFRAKQALAEASKAAASSVRRVEVITPKLGSGTRNVALPGSVRPLEETVVYSRANGYVSSWKVDIGDKVQEGDLLAEIDTPELDQQLQEARAELEKAKANLAHAEVNREYASVNLKRSEGLVAEGVAPMQELDDRKAQSQVGEANVNVGRAVVSAGQAKVRQLSQLKAYAKIVAPFSGTVSSRSIERGALVSPTTPLFEIAATDTVRVFVNVPQNIAPHVRAGADAKVKVREYPGKSFAGKIARTSGTLDAATRTLNTEVRVPNEDGKLMAGMYAEVELDIASPQTIVEIPATALVNDAAGLRVAIVDEQNKIRFAPITIERDTGATLLVASGLNGKERVVRVASAALTDGLPVTVGR